MTQGEEIPLRSARIRWANAPFEGQHALIHDEGAYVTLCANNHRYEHAHLMWDTDAKKCSDCLAYYEVVLSERARRRRQREAERRRQRYQEDKEYRRRVLDNNQRSVQKHQVDSKDPLDTFDEQLEVYRKKWAAEDK